MEAKHYILTGLTAYALLQSSCKEAGEPFPFSAEKSAEVLKTFLNTSKTVSNTNITLTPLIVAWKKAPFRKRGWTYELSDIQESMYVGHFDSLYEVTLKDAEFMPHQLIDAIHAARAVLQNPLASEVALVEINSSDIPKNRSFLVSQLEELYWRDHGRQARDDFAQLFSLRSGSSGTTDERMWKLVPVFLRHEKLLYAALFLKASQDEYMFRGDEIEEAILNKDGPIHVHDAVRAENAIHNAYKVIEALWGGNLPADAKKIDKGFAELGINTDEQVGYAHHGIHPKQSIREKIALLRKARDERAAHGRIGANRKATYYEILDYQALAHAALYRHIAHEWPESV